MLMVMPTSAVGIVPWLALTAPDGRPEPVPALAVLAAAAAAAAIIALLIRPLPSGPAVAAAGQRATADPDSPGAVS